MGAAPLARSRIAALAGVASIAFVLAAEAAAEVRLDVGGAVEDASDTLDVRVDVGNTGAAAATTLDVRAEFGTEEDLVSLSDGVPAGETRSVRFHFGWVPPPGVYVLGLRLDYTEAGASGAKVTASQRAYLLLSLGASAPPAVVISAGEARLHTTGIVPVRVESADGAAHRVRLRLLTPRGLNPGGPVDLDVPATGAATARLGLIAGNAPRPSQQGILVVAEVVGGPIAMASVAATVAHVDPYPALLPRLRWPLGGAALALLAAAAAIEVRSRRLRAAAAGSVEPEAEVRPSS